jgi:hypothetical protein
MRGRELDSSGSGWGHAVGCCKHGNESSDFIKYTEFHDWPWNCSLLKKGSAPWSYFGNEKG